MSTIQNYFPTKGTYETEHSGGTWIPDQVKADFEEITQTMRNWARSYVKWSLVLDQKMGPHTGGCGTCTPIVNVNTSTAAGNYDIALHSQARFRNDGLLRATLVHSNKTVRDMS